MLPPITLGHPDANSQTSRDHHWTNRPEGVALLFTLLRTGSSSVFVPAAMRQAVPEANPGLFELLSLSVTFPFNISLDISLDYGVISRLW